MEITPQLKIIYFLIHGLNCKISECKILEIKNLYRIRVCGVMYIEDACGKLLSCIIKLICVYIYLYIIYVNALLDIDEVEILRKMKY